MKKTEIRCMVSAALCVAIGVTLPQAFHMIPNAGTIFLPMHIPVLLCGLVCGWKYGFMVGMITPTISSVLTGMPGAAILPGMIFELGVYGMVTGAISANLRLSSRYANLYTALITAMLAGRVCSGVLNALIFRAGEYSLSLWLTASFVTALPGIIIQLVLIPSLILALEKARVLPGLSPA